MYWFFEYEVAKGIWFYFRVLVFLFVCLWKMFIIFCEQNYHARFFISHEALSNTLLCVCQLLWSEHIDLGGTQLWVVVFLYQFFAIILVHVPFWALQNLSSLRGCKLRRLHFTTKTNKNTNFMPGHLVFSSPWGNDFSRSIHSDATFIYYLWAWQKASVYIIGYDDVTLQNTSFCVQGW